MHGVQGAAASAMHRAMLNNPEATAKVMSAGLRHAANSTSRTGTGVGAGSGSGTGVSMHLSVYLSIYLDLGSF